MHCNCIQYFEILPNEGHPAPPSFCYECRPAYQSWLKIFSCIYCAAAMKNYPPKTFSEVTGVHQMLLYFFLMVISNCNHNKCVSVSSGLGVLSYSVPLNFLFRHGWASWFRRLRKCISLHFPNLISKNELRNYFQSVMYEH